MPKEKAPKSPRRLTYEANCNELRGKYLNLGQLITLTLALESLALNEIKSFVACGLINVSMQFANAAFSSREDRKRDEALHAFLQADVQETTSPDNNLTQREAHVFTRRNLFQAAA